MQVRDHATLDHGDVCVVCKPADVGFVVGWASLVCAWGRAISQCSRHSRSKRQSPRQPTVNECRSHDSCYTDGVYHCCMPVSALAFAHGGHTHENKTSTPKHVPATPWSAPRQRLGWVLPACTAPAAKGFVPETCHLEIPCFAPARPPAVLHDPVRAVTSVPIATLARALVRATC